MIGLIDGDILTYRIGFTTQDVPVQIACSRMDETVSRIVSGAGVDEFKVFLTGTDKQCFRFDLYKDYKANRKQPKPVWYQELRAHLIHDYEASVSTTIEADDAIGIAQDKTNYSTVICSIDKDLDQIPGKHYDFVKEVAYDVEPERAIRFFYLQLLQGDRVDNIPGIPGIGPKKADAILAGLESEEEYLEACVEAYQNADLSLEYMNLMGQLLRIKQSMEEPLWSVDEAVWNNSLRNISTETE